MKNKSYEKKVLIEHILQRAGTEWKSCMINNKEEDLGGAYLSIKVILFVNMIFTDGCDVNVLY